MLADRLWLNFLGCTTEKTRRSAGSYISKLQCVAYGLKLASLRSITVLHDAGVVISRLPDAVV